ncbi:peroxidase family protein [Labrenzia sp. PHM005]|uniref:peroxidase family protein n=1 Tax=Labrenzia sp. PHM005 TaxID=2590016 RepID=UPI0011406B72|nr:peroxidase family protein [Labrenzia sp. PHM005]QDG76577.1 hypothetical protein FJ695_12240 [Labrenzia sp. PHM005]
MHLLKSTLRLETVFSDFEQSNFLKRRSPFPALSNGTRPAPADLYSGIEANGKLDKRRTEDLFRNIALLMEAAGTSGPVYGNWGENPRIPAGYTYFAQLIAHDITINGEIRPNMEAPKVRTNVQNDALMLNTLYGSGPLVSAHCYDFKSDFKGIDARLKLGPVTHNKSTVNQPKRDICRYQEYDDSGVKRGGRPLIADARNDNNPILSQLTALFSHFHNIVVGYSEEQHPGSDIDTHFNFAKAVVLYVYRNIIRNDFLQKLLDPNIYHYYSRSQDPDRYLFEVDENNPVTSEFTHAAYRFGHAMVRPLYEMSERMNGEAFTLEDVLGQTSDGEPNRAPLNDDWIAAWSFFFDLPDRTPAVVSQKSNLLGPLYMRALNSKLKDGVHFDNDTLAYLDLLRCVSAPVLKVERLRQHILQTVPTKPDFPAASRQTIANSADIAAEIKSFADRPTRPIGSGVLPPRLTTETIDELSGNPPLGLFVLIEANSGPGQGQHLGPIGSIIVAETLFRAVDDDRGLQQLELPNSHTPQIAASILFQQTGAGPIPQTMPDLIRWIDHHLPDEYKTLEDGSRLSFL